MPRSPARREARAPEEFLLDEKTTPARIMAPMSQSPLADEREPPLCSDEHFPVPDERPRSPLPDEEGPRPRRKQKSRRNNPKPQRPRKFPQNRKQGQHHHKKRPLVYSDMDDTAICSGGGCSGKHKVLLVVETPNTIKTLGFGSLGTGPKAFPTCN